MAKRKLPNNKNKKKSRLITGFNENFNVGDLVVDQLQVNTKFVEQLSLGRRKRETREKQRRREEDEFTAVREGIITSGGAPLSATEVRNARQRRNFFGGSAIRSGTIRGI